MAAEAEGPEPSPSEAYGWGAFRDRLFRFGRNLLRFENQIESVSKAQAEQQRIVNDLSRRMDRVEAKLDVILALLSSGKAP